MTNTRAEASAPSSPHAGVDPLAGHGLADHLSHLARTLQGEEDVADTLDAIVQAAVGTVPGAEHASISVIRQRRDVKTMAASSELARSIDRAQYETGQGPCLDSLYQERTARLPYLPREERWPQFVERAVGLGVGSMLAVQLYVARDDLGALNLFSASAAAFDDESEHVALLFASHAAVAMAGAQQQAHLRQAVSRRDTIGQAKGILMERHKMSAELAFRVLTRASQSQNIKLHDIAEELIRSSDLGT